MTKRWLAFCIIGCLGTWCFSGCGKIGGHSGGRVLSVSMASIPNVKLKRPPVRFDHDRHTDVLGSEQEDCRKCHNTDDSQNLLFEFPKDRDETKPRVLMDSIHGSCVGCHTERTKAGEELSGPLTCGECHVIQRGRPDKAYEPVLPEYYNAKRDIYHQDCAACHRETAKHAKTLDWHRFYVDQKEQAKADWPGVRFDYYLHGRHSKAKMGQCFECHHGISRERWQEVMAAGGMPSAQDLGMDVRRTTGRNHRQTAHARCINCHLNERADNPGGGGRPVQCSGCHRDVERTLEELAAPRPMCEREERILLQLEEGATQKAVAFNHASHVANSRACRDCHHKTLQPCRDCHTVDGCQEGGGVTLAEAHHDVSSRHSCVGCHDAVKSRPSCAGCHQKMQRGLVQSACSSCHSGSLEELDKVVDLPAPEDLIPDDVNAEMEIVKIQKAYGPSMFPHLEMAHRLTLISNQSMLARHFHTDKMTICAGCHHLSPMEAKTGMPPCSTCHTARDEPFAQIPTLLGAYHQQCLGCHQEMDPAEQRLPQDCTGCHQEQ